MAPGVPFRDGAGNSFDKRGESKMIRGDDKDIPRATTNGVQIFQSRNGTEPTMTLSEKSNYEVGPIKRKSRAVVSKSRDE